MEPITQDKYFDEAKKRYGDNIDNWKFKCPSCGNAMTVGMYKEAAQVAGIKNYSGQVAYSCIGRLMPNPVDMGVKGKGFCNYAGGGLFKLNPIPILRPMANGVVPEKADIDYFFDFADDPLKEVK